MTEIEVVKNILLGKTCSNCSLNSKYSCPCLYVEYDDELKERAYSKTHNYTCLSWRERGNR